MERHIQTAIQVILVGLILWVGNTTLETRDSIIELKTQMVEARQQIGEMNQRFDRYMLRSEAEARLNALNGSIGEMSRRVEKIEERRP